MSLEEIAAMAIDIPKKKKMALGYIRFKRVLTVFLRILLLDEN